MIEWFPDYVVRSLLAGLSVALVAGPMGSLVIWQRMAYFGDALAHASLLGITLSLFFALPLTLGVLAVALGVSLLLVYLQSRSWFANDTLLGLLSHSGLALGLLSLNLLPPTRVDLMAYLYGDILAVTWPEVMLMLAGTVIVLGLLKVLWSKLIQYIIHPDLALVEGVNIKRVKFLFILLLAFTVAMGIKIVGVLLMTALMIMPAAASQMVSSSPEGVAIKASLIGAFAVLLGIVSSFYYDLATGPAIVVAMALIFFSLVIARRKVI